MTGPATMTTPGRISGPHRKTLCSGTYEHPLRTAGLLLGLLLTVLPAAARAQSPWSTGNDMPTARYQPMAGLINGKIYVAGGYYSGWIDSLEAYDVATGIWTPGLAHMNYHHIWGAHGVIDGKLYVVGGGTPQLEYYDPIGNTWTVQDTIPLDMERTVSAAVGNVLYVIGGRYSGSYIDSVFAYDAVADSWTRKANMPTGRWMAGAATIGGKIYVVGGYDGSSELGTLEIYDPVADSWSTGAPLPIGMNEPVVAALDGQLYVGGSYYTGFYVYDPGQDLWTQRTDRPAADRMMAVETYGDRIFYLGGYDYQGDYLSTVRIYDRTIDRWSTLRPLALGRTDAGSAWLDGKVYVVGGYAGSTGSARADLDVYDPATGEWTSLAPMNYPRQFCAVVPYRGKLYVLGGSDSYQFEIYDVATNTWTDKSPLPTNFWSALATEIDGRIYLTGSTSSLCIYDIAAGTWTFGPTIPQPISYSASGTIDGKWYVVGGYAGGALDLLQIYNPQGGGSWSGGASMNTPRYFHATMVDGGKLYAVGGQTDAGFTDQVEVYDPTANSWSVSGHVAIEPISQMTSAAGNGILYMAGGTGSTDTRFMAFRVGDLRGNRLRLTPKAGAIEVSKDTEIVIDFDWPVDGSSINTSNISVTSGATPVPGSLQFVPSLNRVVFTPADTLVKGSTVNVSLSGAIQDTAGIGFDGDNDGIPMGAVTDDFDYSFTVGSNNPVVVIDAVSGLEHPTGVVTINYTITSPVDDGMQTVDWQFSRDNQVWYPIDASAIGNRAARLSGSYYITWDTWAGSYNLDHVIDETVWFRMRVKDPTPLYSGFSSSDTLAIDNNRSPVVVSFGPVSGEKSGGIPIPLALDDAEGDTLNIAVRYSLDQGGSWHVATISEDTTGIVPAGYSGSITWLSGTDAPGVDQPDTWLTIQPSDRFAGLADTLKGLWLDNNQLPAITFPKPSGTQSDSVWVSYTVTDAEGDTVTVTGEYTLDAGSTWHPATLSGTTVVWPGGYGQTIAWLSHIDEPSVPLNIEVGLRLTPTDRDPGPTYIPPGYLTLENNAPPTVDLNIRSALGGEVQVGYRLHDIEGDDLSYAVAYSTDGTNWSSASITGMTSSITPAVYDSVFTWHSGTDLPGREGPAHLRVTPSDAFSTEPLEIHSDPVIVDFYLDNTAPDTLTATGSGNGNVFEYWFNEPVTRSSAAVPGNINLSGGITVDSVSVAIERTPGPDMPEGRQRPTVVTLGGCLYVIGGNGTEYLVSRFDPTTGLWTSCAPSNGYHYGSIAGVIGDRIYVVGGGTAQVEYYDPDTDTWTWTGHTGSYTGEYSSVGGVIDGKLYMAGGSTSYYTLRRYDPANATTPWENLNNLPLGVNDAAGGVVGGKLYVAGGNDGSFNRAELQIYDPVSGWSLGAPMPTVLIWSTATVVEDQLYLIGGYNGIEYMDDAYRYDPATDTWTVEPTPWLAGPPDLVYLTGAAALNGRVHVVGGYRLNDGQNSTALQIIDPANRFFGHLSPGQALPGPETAVTVTASNISDHFGNIAASVDGDFNPTTGDVPSITLPDVYHSAVSGDVTVPYQISDTEGNAVSLLAEYSTDGGANWAPAAVTGDTSGIGPANYQGSMVWNSRTDLSGLDGAFLFRLTPRDNVTPGVAGSVSIRIDNMAPAQIFASGSGAGDRFEFSFDQPASVSATDTANVSLTGGLSVGRIVPIPHITELGSLPETRQQQSLAVINGMLYVVGGSSAPYLFRRYEIGTGTWTQLADNQGYRSSAVAFPIGEKLYVAGGGDDRIESFDPTTGTWSFGTSGTMTGAYYAAGGVIDGKFYLAGGMSGEVRNELRWYDPATTSWYNGTGMPIAVQAAAGGAIGDRLYIAGGQDASGSTYLNSLYIYDSVTDSWDQGADLPSPLAWSSAVVVDGRLYLIGGHTGMAPIRTAYIYDPGLDSWSVEPYDWLSEPTMSGAACADGVTVYYHSGYGSESSTDLNRLSSIDPYYHFRAELTPGQILPGPETTVTVTATNISDRLGNVAASLTTDFNPTTGNIPTVVIPWQYGVFGGDVTIPYQLSDDEGNAVTLLAEYSTDGGSAWIPAAVTGDTSGILPVAYNGSLVWNSVSDLLDQVNPNVGFRLTPWDDSTNRGTPVEISLGIDNLAPGTLYAEGFGNGDKVTFWFDEQVLGASARNPAGITISGGLAVGSVRSIPASVDATAMQYSRESHVMAVMGRKLYAAGGYESPYNFEVYDPATGNWTELAGTNSYHGGGPVLGAIGGKLYLVGGGGPTNVESWDPETNTWVYGSGGPDTEHQNAAGGVIDGRLYFAGGDLSGLTSRTSSYDPATDTWAAHAMMPVAIQRAAYGVIDRKLYVAGGVDDSGLSDLLQIYDPDSDNWSFGANLPTMLYAAAGAVFEGRLYVIGGNDGIGYTTNAYIYDPATDAWTIDSEPWLPEPYSCCKAVSMSGRIHLTGGAEPGGAAQTLHKIINPNDRFEATLSDGNVLPGPETQVTMSIQNVEDLYGNVKTSISTDFYPGTGDVPSVTLGDPTEVQGGDIGIRFLITDSESNAVTLSAEYSVDGRANWNPATLSGSYTDIVPSGYAGTLTWLSRTDLPGHLDDVWFKITPRDNETTPGIPDSIYFALDNKAPAWIAATGSSGDTTITFWFDESVEQAAATDLSNFSLSGGLTIKSIADIGMGGWTAGVAMPTGMERAASGVIDGRLYAAGGNLNDFMSTLQVYDPSSGSWMVKSSMPTARYDATAGVIDGRLYVVGGYGNGGYTGTMEVYDPSTNSWSTKASMPTARCRATAGVINGRLYVVGGLLDGGGSVGTLEVYDPATDSWATKASMPTARRESAAGVIGGRLCVVGGYSDSGYLGTLEVYDSATDSWMTKADMPTSRSIAVAGAIGGKLYVVGGYTGSSYLSTVEVYDPTTNSWKTEAPMPTGRCAAAAGVIDGRLYVAGGSGDVWYLNTLEVYTAPLERFALTLTDGQTLPSAETSVTIAATNIPDPFGNVAASLDTTFHPSTGEVPRITLVGIARTMSGDIPVRFQISDDEHNPVSISAEYSTDGTTWLNASVLGNLSSIYYSSYEDMLVWQSRTDLDGQQFDQVWFKVTPRDNETIPGVPDSVFIRLDNKPPGGVEATGDGNGITIEFWFDEPVRGSTATNPASVSLSGGLMIDTIRAVVQRQTGSPIALARYGHASLAYQGMVYIYGGGNADPSLERYDPAADSWMTLASSVAGRWSGPILGAIRGKLYAVGGGDDRIEIYDPSTDSWSWGPAGTQTGANNSAGGVIEDRLYMAGGESSGQLNSLRVFDPAANQWADKAPMPFAVHSAAHGILNGRLYVAGGNDGGGYTTHLQIYDPATDSWSSGHSLPGPIGQGAGGVVIDEKLYVIGGYDLNTAYIYDPLTDSWVVDTQMWLPDTIGAPTVVFLDGNVLATGGWDSQAGWYTDKLTILDPTTRYRADLISGDSLPGPETLVTLTAANISDLYGNIATSLPTSFNPTTGDVPTIVLTAPAGTQGGDIQIPFQISDPEGNTVNLTAEYSTDGRASWSPATLSGLVSGIAPVAYADTTTWQSRTDLPGQLLEDVWLKITPWDNTTVPGVPDSVMVRLDNKPPGGVAASGVVGKASFEFWFDETVDEASATNSANYLLSGGFTVQSISSIGTESWTTAASMPTANEAPAAAAINGKLYAAGGSSYCALEVYDPATDSWTTAGFMPTVRWGAAGAAIGGKLYLAGGQNGGGFISTPEVYDPATNSWTPLASMPTVRYTPAAAAVAGKLYVAGGWSYGASLSTLEVYDPGTDSWTTAASMPTVRCGAAAAAIAGKLYVAGGQVGSNVLNTLEVYDPATDGWTTAASMSTPRYGAAAVAIDGKLYVVGGDDGSSLSTLEVYDPTTDDWTTAASMSTARQNAAAAAIAGKLYVAGGYDGSSYLSTLEVYTPSRLTLALTSGQTLPFGQLTLTASNITDLHGNVAASLSTDFYPSTGEVPTIVLPAPTGTQGGDIGFPFQISDVESNPVSLTAEYSTDGQSSWQTATLDGSYANLTSAAYTGTLVWQSRTDLAGHLGEVWVKITPADNPTTPGTPVSVSFRLDNKPPALVTASGLVGEDSFQFGFDEAVDATTATDPANISLTGGLTVDAVQSVLSTHGGAAMPLARKSSGSTILNGRLYVIGGDTNGQSVHEYDPVADSWTTKASMTYIHEGPVAGVIGGKVYVVGGYGGGYMEVYDPAANSWTSLSGGTNTYQYNPSGGVIGDSLLVAGGMWASISNTLEFYNTVTQTWTGGPNMLEGVTNAASVVIDRKLYIAGGTNASGISATLQIYDPATNQWNYGSSLPVSLTDPTGVAADGKFYCIGGRVDGTTTITTAYIYDPAADSWTPDTQDWLPAPVYDGVAEYIDGMIYFTGGWDSSTYQASSRLVVINLFATFSAQLSAGQTLPFQQLTLTASNIADRYGNIAPTLTLDWVPQDTNSDPTITVYDIPDEVSGDVTVSYLIADGEGDLIRIEPEYSVDSGNNWLTPTITGTVTDIASGAYDGSLVWHSATDLPGADLTGVWFRITTFDNTIETGGSDRVTLHVDNNQVPEIVITDAVYSRADSLWTFSYTLTDAEDDTLKLVAQYSLDGGSNLLAATIEGRGDTLLPGDYVNQIIWRSEVDIPQTVQELIFSLTPWDHDAGAPATQALLHNALGLPTTQLTWTWSGEQSGDIAFDFQADDVDMEALTLYFDYHHPDGNWYYATITGEGVDHQAQPIALSDPTAYTGSFVWHSADDLPGLDLAAVEFRVRPHDTTQEGIGTTVGLHLDNNVPPTVTVGTPSGTVSRNVTIPVTLSDAEGDTLHYRVMYSLDAASGVWHDATVLNNTTEILTGGYAHNLTWDSMADVGYMHSDLITIQVQPADHDTGPWGITSAISLANYVGDYTGDIAVDFADFATLVSAWNSQDTYHDIGPATGTVPDLVPVYDGKIDFEDLAVYAMMWTWSYAQPPAVAARAIARPVTTRAAGRKTAEKDDHPVRLEQPLPDDPWAPDDGILELRFQTSGVSGLTAAGLTLEYDTRYLRLREVVPGPMLGTTGGTKPSLVQLKRVNEEEGRIELLLGRIDSERPSVSGSGMLAVARFDKLSREDSVVRVTYDLRDRRAAKIAGGDYEASVQATLRPTEFALLQNYPNPFNGETVIRFQLPTEQRVQIQLYNMRGQLVTTLLDERREAGYHRVSWNGRDAAGRPVASGIYIYLIQAGTHRESKKLVILK